MGRLQTARLENFIRRWGSIKGPGSVLSETLGDVFPILDLENLTPENELTAGWTTFWGFVTVIGIAAQTTGASVINPVASGQLAVVDGVIMRRETAGGVTIGSSLPLFALAAGLRARDRRGSATTGSVRIGANANVGAVATGLSIILPANTDRTIEIPRALAVLPPGTQLEVVNNTADDNLTVSFYGRTRVAEPSELSF